MNLIRRCILLFTGLLTLVIITGCAREAVQPGTSPTQASTELPAAAGSSLKVFAAASLSDAFQEIGAEFHTLNPGVPVEFNFAGSQQLAQQIAQGAPADVFASANKKQMDILTQEGEVAAGQEKVFAQNRLVVIFPKDNPAKINAAGGPGKTRDQSPPGSKRSPRRAICAGVPGKGQPGAWFRPDVPASCIK